MHFFLLFFGHVHGLIGTVEVLILENGGQFQEMGKGQFFLVALFVFVVVHSHLATRNSVI